MRSFATPLASALLGAGALLTTSLAHAVAPATVSPADPRPDAAAASSARQDDSPEQEAPALVAIRAGRVIVRPGHELENAVVLVRGDRIQAVGTDVTVPDGARVLEAAVVCAGFIDAWSAVGIDRGSLFDRGVKPSTRSADALETYDDAYVRRAALRAGVTTVRSQIGEPANVQGTGVVLRLLPDPEDERAILSADACVAMEVLGNDALDRVSNVDRLLSQVESGANYRKALRKYESDLAEWEKAIAEKTEELEKDFKKAKKDREKEIEDAKEKGKDFKEKSYKEDRKPKPPRFDADGEVLGAVADGEMPLVVELHRVPELRQFLARLPEFGRVRPILAGCSDARFVADRIAEAGLAVIVNPVEQGRGGTYGADELELAADLNEAGVEVILGSGGVDPNATAALPLLAARAVGHGLPHDVALAAITTAPARALDLADTIGTVEPGKQADLLLLSGDPFASATHVEHVVVAGEVIEP